MLFRAAQPDGSQKAANDILDGVGLALLAFGVGDCDFHWLSPPLWALKFSMA